jgi:hypothetical protein
MKSQLLWTLLLFSCNSNSDTDIQTKTAATMDNAKTLTLNKRDRGFQKSVKLLDNHLPFDILPFTNTLNKNTTDTNTSKCGSWILTKKDIAEIINNSEPIDGTTWDLSFSVLTCTKSVKVSQRGQQYNVEINAAAFFSSSNGDTTILFGDFKKADRKYFIEGPSNQ